MVHVFDFGEQYDILMRTGGQKVFNVSRFHWLLIDQPLEHIYVLEKLYKDDTWLKMTFGKEKSRTCKVFNDIGFRFQFVLSFLTSFCLVNCSSELAVETLNMLL